MARKQQIDFQEKGEKMLRIIVKPDGTGVLIEYDEEKKGK